ncbi:Uncharacterised protein [Mycobacteroides abscessus]|nr:Uncharacterised protein [Mycobacteroides abscessus]
MDAGTETAASTTPSRLGASHHHVRRRRPVRSATASAATSARAPSSGGACATGVHDGDGPCCTTEPTPMRTTSTPKTTRSRDPAPTASATPGAGRGPGPGRRAASTTAAPARTNARLVHVLSGSAQGVPPASSHAPPTPPPPPRSPSDPAYGDRPRHRRPHRSARRRSPRVRTRGCAGQPICGSLLK